MKKLFSVAAIAMSVLAGGCAIHPVPEDVTGVDSVIIARQIRCEARETVVDSIKFWLSRLAANNHQRAQELLQLYETSPDAINDFSYALFKDPRDRFIRSMAKVFNDAGVAYTFDLTMTESNDLSAGVSFVRPLIQPRVTLGLGGAANRRRVNNRVFTLTDTFGGLLKMNVLVRGVRYCDGHVVQANYAYPIAGKIGVDKVMTDFIRLTLFTNLGGKPDGSGPPTMTDKLTFTTTLSAAADPAVVFTPVTSAFQVANASLSASAGRTDAHQVTVGLAINPEGRTELGPLRAFLFSPNRDTLTRQAPGASGLRDDSQLYVGTRVIGGGTPAEKLAVIANDQAKSREVQFVPQ